MIIMKPKEKLINLILGNYWDKMPKKQQDKKKLEPVTRDYTINLHKRIHKITFKRRAGRAIREIAKFAKKNMLTDDVRVD